MKKADDTKSVRAPKLDAEHWYRAALTFAAFSIVLMGFAAIQMIASNSLSEAKDVAAVFQPFFVAAAALVTFCTIAWRGIISAQQLEAQKQANWSKDGENAAKLLQEGAKLLGEREKPSHVLAGVASLAALLNDKEVRFQIQAMDLLADFYLENYARPEQDRVLNAVRRALHQGVIGGYRSTVSALFRAPNVNDEKPTKYYWQPVFGFTHQIYVGGDFTNRDYKAISVEPALSFNRCTFHRCDITSYSYAACSFLSCTVRSIVADDLDTRNQFVDTCFNSANILQGSVVVDLKTIDLRQGGNWFASHLPPVAGHFVNWTDILIAHDIKARINHDTLEGQH